MKATGMIDDDANNWSLQQKYNDFNVGKIALTVDDSSAKDPTTMSPITWPINDTIFINSHTTGSISGINRKHPPLTKQIRE